jgi:hypothetical protein
MHGALESRIMPLHIGSLAGRNMIRLRSRTLVMKSFGSGRFLASAQVSHMQQHIHLPISKSVRFLLVFTVVIAGVGSTDLRAQTTKVPARVAMLNPFSPPDPAGARL